MIYEYNDFGFIGFDVMAEDFVCMVDRVALPNEFKEGNSNFGNSLALAHGALQGHIGPRLRRLGHVRGPRRHSRELHGCVGLKCRQGKFASIDATRLAGPRRPLTTPAMASSSRTQMSLTTIARILNLLVLALMRPAGVLTTRAAAVGIRRSRLRSPEAGLRLRP